MSRRAGELFFLFSELKVGRGKHDGQSEKKRERRSVLAMLSFIFFCSGLEIRKAKIRDDVDTSFSSKKKEKEKEKSEDRRTDLQYRPLVSSNSRRTAGTDHKNEVMLFLSSFFVRELFPTFGLLVFGR